MIAGKEISTSQAIKTGCTYDKRKLPVHVFGRKIQMKFLSFLAPDQNSGNGESECELPRFCTVFPYVRGRQQRSRNHRSHDLSVSVRGRERPYEHFFGPSRNTKTGHVHRVPILWTASLSYHRFILCSALKP